MTKDEISHWGVEYEGEAIAHYDLLNQIKNLREDLDYWRSKVNCNTGDLKKDTIILETVNDRLSKAIVSLNKEIKWFQDFIEK